VRNKLEQVRITNKESERKLVRFEIKLGNPLISQPFEICFEILNNVMEKYQKLYNLLKKCLD